MTTPTPQPDHATWSASSTSRNWACPGALALGATLQKLDVESEAAGWGTTCHTLSEKCLRTGLDAADRIGDVIKTKQREFEVDEDMAETAQMYVDYVRNRQAEYNFGRRDGEAALYIEQRFSLAALDPPFDAGGTADAVIYFPAWKLIEVIDLKGGRGMKVEVTENKQTRTYALGAMLGNPGLNVERVMSTIVQPRIAHPDGRIRSETMHVTELAEWTGELRGAMQRSAQAMADYGKITGALTREKWTELHVKAGDHCTFCPAAGICPALEKKALDTANAFFNDSGTVEIRNQPGDLDPARIAQVLDGADTLTTWLNAVRALATASAQRGTEIPGYNLVDKVGRRRWKSEDAVMPALYDTLLCIDDIYAKKLLSPAQMEKLKAADGKKLKGRPEFDALIEAPITGVSLVSAAKSTKPAVASAAERFFA